MELINWDYECIKDLIVQLKNIESDCKETGYSLKKSELLSDIQYYAPFKPLLDYYNNTPPIKFLKTWGECYNNFITIDKKGAALCIYTNLNLVRVKLGYMYSENKIPESQEKEETRCLKELLKFPCSNELYLTIEPNTVKNMIVNEGHWYSWNYHDSLREDDEGEKEDEALLGINQNILSIYKNVKSGLNKEFISTKNNDEYFLELPALIKEGYS